jgi:Tfp pilus assembly protein PilO
MSFDWNAVPNRREQVLFAFVVVGLLLTLIHLSSSFNSSEREAQERRLTALTMERNALQKFIEATPNIYKKSSPLKIEDSKIQVLIGKVSSPYVDLPTLLPQLTAPAFLQGVQLESFSFQPDAHEQGFVRTDFTLETSGNFGDIVKYLDRLESLPALFVIKDIVLSVQGARGSVKGELSCRFFRRGNKV